MKNKSNDCPKWVHIYAIFLITIIAILGLSSFILYIVGLYTYDSDYSYIINLTIAILIPIIMLTFGAGIFLLTYEKYTKISFKNRFLMLCITIGILIVDITYNPLNKLAKKSLAPIDPVMKLLMWDFEGCDGNISYILDFKRENTVEYKIKFNEISSTENFKFKLKNIEDINKSDCAPSYYAFLNDNKNELNKSETIFVFLNEKEFADHLIFRGVDFYIKK